MSDLRFLRGMGIGLAVGAAAAMAMRPKKKTVKSAASKAMHAMEGAVEQVADHIGM